MSSVSGTQPDSPRPAIEQDGTETAADSAAAGLIPPIRSQGDWQAVQALAAILEPEAFDPDQPALIGWRKRTQAKALAHAAKVITEGYVRVSVDDATVDRLVRAFMPNVENIRRTSDSNLEVARFLARAAVQALRDGGQQ